MKVSVSIITYNHAPFIRRAIESALMQRTNFEFEILIGEDDSSDGTREIVRKYAAKYPGKIRAFLHDRKDVLYIDGRPSSRRNFANNLKNAQGEYIAMLDGDDYWLSPDKLQRQADFLDQHPECSACFHPAKVVYENEEGSDRTFRRVAKDFYTLADLLSAGFTVQTCCYFFRNRLFPELPAWYFTVPIGDLPLHALVAQYGLLGWMDGEMSVYNVHRGGIFSGGVKEAVLPPEVRRRRLASYVAYYEIVNRALDGKYYGIIRDKLSILNYDIVYTYQQEGNLPMMRQHLRAAARHGLTNSQTSRRFILKTWFIAYVLHFNSLYQACRKTGSRDKNA